MGKIIKKTDFKSPFTRPELSIQECRLILCKSGAKYSGKEIEEIRILMLNLVEIEYLSFKTKQIAKNEEAKIVPLKTRDASENNFKETG